MSRSIRSSRKLCYKIRGTLPAIYEDFTSDERGIPNVTIITEGNRQPGDELSESVKGWRLVFVPGDTLTLDTARRELARINGVDAMDIMIHQENLMQAT